MANKTTLTGTLRVIGDVQNFGSNGFSKREIVVETINGAYVNQIPFELVKDKANLIETFQVNETVTVYYDPRGNEHNGRYFVTLNAWKIERPNQAGQQPQQQNQTGGNENW